MIMSINDEFSNLYRQRDWQALHRALDSSSPGRDADERNHIAHWRAAALAAEDRCLEAIDVLTANRTDCRCKTRVCMNIAENLHRLGRDMDAIEELLEIEVDVVSDDDEPTRGSMPAVYFFLREEECTDAPMLRL